ncbi:hypothetical protein DPMN_102611 [Dreissena polymorpha]|uniref:CARD domain-containing protein n=1 Tax=Dreissena polymorpha TaxID=45954 RepID=A0A9D4LLF2_DREPO|nr:hypothetical protein DPMN_102611 [Dreissena polymorpha]
MDITARKVLKQKKALIKENLVLETSILDELESKDILTEDMSLDIQAKSTNGEKIDRFLSILKKRGPTAFEAFIASLQKDHGFVAVMLMEEYNALADAENERRMSTTSLSTNGSTSSLDSQTKSLEMNAVMFSQCNDCAVRRLSQDTSVTSGSNKTSQSTAVIGQLRDKTDQSDAGQLISTGQLHISEEFKTRIIQEWLSNVYMKLKSHVTINNLRELSFNSPGPVTYEMVENLIDDMMLMEEKCYKAIGAKDRKASLLTHIISLKASKQKMKERVKLAEEQKNKYADNIIKLENKCRNNLDENDRLKREIQKQVCTNLSLKESCDQKQKKIEELQKLLDKANEEIEMKISKIEEMGKLFREREDCLREEHKLIVEKLEDELFDSRVDNPKGKFQYKQQYQSTYAAKRGKIEKKYPQISTRIHVQPREQDCTPRQNPNGNKSPFNSNDTPRAQPENRRLKVDLTNERHFENCIMQKGTIFNTLENKAENISEVNKKSPRRQALSIVPKTLETLGIFGHAKK